MNLKKYIIWIFCGLFFIQSQAQNLYAWGDQGNGTYINPVLNTDFSDPDVIRVKNKYYMVCSEFHYMGMTIQESEDLVNWKIVGRVYERLDFPVYDTMQAYGSGSWAPTIRYHDGLFYVYFCTPEEGLFMSTAAQPQGPWTPLHHMVTTKGWEDPCPFWDQNGQAYLGRSQVGAGPIIIHKMSKDGKELLDQGVTVYTGPVAEGTKIYYRNDYYYLSIPEGGVTQGWQTVLRSKNILGPYEKSVVLEEGMSTINGPHQGALVDTPSGEWWFYHFQMVRGAGRIVHLEPVFWKDDWPMIGVDRDRNGIGEPVAVWKSPTLDAESSNYVLQSSDEFDTSELGLQWQWNHNPLDDKWSLTERRGWLSLKASKASDLSTAKNTLTQRIIGWTSEVIVQMDVSKMNNGQKAGLVFMSKFYNIGVRKDTHGLHLYAETSKNHKIKEINLRKSNVYFKATINIPEEEAQFFYSLDGKSYQAFGDAVKLYWRNWKGDRLGLFTYNELSDGGTVMFNFFRSSYDHTSK